MTTSTKVGIEKIRAYVSTQMLDLLELAKARGHDPADLRDNLLTFTRSVNPLWEDPVTMAINAAQPMLSDDGAVAVVVVRRRYRNVPKLLNVPLIGCARLNRRNG